MKLRRTRTEESLVDITSLIDVVFLLLIFFMVSTTFNRESQIDIDLPQASGKQLEAKKFHIEIGIDAQGRYFINQQAVVNTDIETLKRALRKVVGDHKNPQLIISSDRKTPYQAVVTAMDAARQVGLTRLTFATKKKKEQ